MPNNNQQVIRDISNRDVLEKLSGDFLWDNPFQPESNNPLTNNKFKFMVSRCPTFSYFCQRVNIPSLSFNTSLQSNPTGISIRRPGTSYVYEDLQIGFMVDEQMKSWLEIYDWMNEISHSYDNNAPLPEHQKTSTAHVLILNSNYRPKLAVKFKNIYPTFLSSIDFDSSNTDTDSIISTVSFSYTHYEIERFTTNP